MESLILSTLNKKKAVLDQLVKGLKALDVLDHNRKKPFLFEPLFVSSPTEDLKGGVHISAHMHESKCFFLFLINFMALKIPLTCTHSNHVL